MAPESSPPLPSAPCSTSPVGHLKIPPHLAGSRSGEAAVSDDNSDNDDKPACDQENSQETDRGKSLQSSSTPVAPKSPVEGHLPAFTQHRHISSRRADGLNGKLDVRIDVKGAYIVDGSESESEREGQGQTGGNGGAGVGRGRRGGRRRGLRDEESAREHGGDEDEEESAEWRHDTSDIRLPHHRSVVSHMAVDVSGGCFPFSTVAWVGNRRKRCGRNRMDEWLMLIAPDVDWRELDQTMLLVLRGRPARQGRPNELSKIPHRQH